MKTSLLAKAKAFKSKTPDKDRAELAVGWATGEVTFTQVSTALGLSAGNGTYSGLAMGLRDAVKLGLLKVAA